MPDARAVKGKQPFKRKLHKSFIKSTVFLVLIPLMAFWVFVFSYNYFSRENRNQTANQIISKQIGTLYGEYFLSSR